VRIWDLDHNAKQKMMLGTVPENLTGGGVGSGHKHIVTSVCFSPDGMYVASGSFDKTLRIWSLSDGSTLAILSGHMQVVNSAAWHPSAAALLTGSVDCTVRLWRLSQNGDDDLSLFPWGNGVILEFSFAHTQASFLSDDHADSEDYHRRTNRQRKHIPAMKCDLTTLLASAPVVAAIFTETGAQVTCFTSTKVQILTPQKLRRQKDCRSKHRRFYTRVD
jgi:WD40 repeat protein